MLKITEIQVPNVGVVPAKPAGEFRPGEVIQQSYGYTLEVTDILSETEDKITFKVLHVPEENEYWDGKSSHIEVFHKSDLLGLQNNIEK